MLKKIQFSFTYDGSPTGDSDRDAFKAALDTEITGPNVVPTIYWHNNTENSSSTLSGDVVTGVIFYMPTNGGIAAWNAFWSTLGTEYAKSTVVKTLAASDANKHDCFHDEEKGCKNVVSIS